MVMGELVIICRAFGSRNLLYIFRPSYQSCMSKSRILWLAVCFWLGLLRSGPKSVTRWSPNNKDRSYNTFMYLQRIPVSSETRVNYFVRRKRNKFAWQKWGFFLNGDKDYCTVQWLHGTNGPSVRYRVLFWGDSIKRVWELTQSSSSDFQPFSSSPYKRQIYHL